MNEVADHYNFRPSARVGETERELHVCTLTRSPFPLVDGPFSQDLVPGRGGELGRRLLLFYLFEGGCPSVHPPLVLGARRLVAADRLSDLF